MARQKKKTKQRQPQAARQSPLGPASAPVSAVDALTIGWMLTVLTTFICELGALAARWYAASHPPDIHVTAMVFVVTFAAVVIGLLSLALLPAVLKMRKTPPPLAVTLVAVLIGLSPLATLIF